MFLFYVAPISPFSCLLSLIKVLFVFLLSGNTLGLARAPTGPGSGGRPGVPFSGGLPSGPSSSLLRSPVCSRGHKGRQGRLREASRRGMTPRCLYRGVTLAPPSNEPPPNSLQGWNIHTDRRKVTKQPHRMMKHTCTHAQKMLCIVLLLHTLMHPVLHLKVEPSSACRAPALLLWCRFLFKIPTSDFVNRFNCYNQKQRLNIKKKYTTIKIKSHNGQKKK